MTQQVRSRPREASVAAACASFSLPRGPTNAQPARAETLQTRSQTQTQPTCGSLSLILVLLRHVLPRRRPLRNRALLGLHQGTEPAG